MDDRWWTDWSWVEPCLRKGNTYLHSKFHIAWKHECWMRLWWWKMSAYDPVDAMAIYDQVLVPLKINSLNSEFVETWLSYSFKKTDPITKKCIPFQDSCVVVLESAKIVCDQIDVKEDLNKFILFEFGIHKNLLSGTGNWRCNEAVNLKAWYRHVLSRRQRYMPRQVWMYVLTHPPPPH